MFEKNGKNRLKDINFSCNKESEIIECKGIIVLYWNYINNKDV